ncbi:G-protein-signaling modulator 2-like isoform X2 [Gigantopelta aegis]|uniref:G-protein-signaling modulator 2-like isoform X2 n=1 Tax=Gigantopelta aegis TaxID=1735272 RepID=UPI001B88A0EB|nr:G-protein-signaling modulator 2-like isoform X2 [Gigantopelta aegis]
MDYDGSGSSSVRDCDYCTRALSDKMGEAKASGNLGNTLKVLCKFDEAIACCVRHLDLSREMADKIGEARALYNLGNVYHAKGKHIGRTGHQDPGEFPPEVKDCLQKAAQYYEENLKIVRNLGDRAAQGRACGNLGNTHYLLGNFSQAILYHEERLAIAKEFGDKAAERRAYTNLGNAHIFLGEFEVAADQYKKSLQIAKQLEDQALEAQACYSLGNTYTLLRDYDRAIEFHMRHLQIAQQLHDRVGEGRACWSLGNAHLALGNHETAMQFATLHLEISQEIGDETGQMTAQMTLTDLRTTLGMPDNVKERVKITSTTGQKEPEKGQDVPDVGISRPNRGRRLSMENMELMKLTPDKQKNNKNQLNSGARPKVQKSATLTTELEYSQHEEKTNSSSRLTHAHSSAGSEKADEEDDSFFDLLSRFQSRRIDDQRCSIRLAENGGVATPKEKPSKPSVAAQVASPGADDFLDMVAGIQGSRMNDQRAELATFPGLSSQAMIGQLLQSKTEETLPDDSFFEMLMRCQGTRLEDQRSALPQIPPAPTVPDEDFFKLIQKVQSSRLEEQRTSMPKDQVSTGIFKKSTNSSGKKKKK